MRKPKKHSAPKKAREWTAWTTVDADGPSIVFPEPRFSRQDISSMSSKDRRDVIRVRITEVPNAR